MTPTLRGVARIAGRGRPCRTVLVACGVAAMAATDVPSQVPSTPVPVFRVGSELVVVDLVPTSRDGRFVDNLKPEELQVFEDGRPQRVQFLRVVRPGESQSEMFVGSPDSDAPAVGLPSAPRPPESLTGPALVVVIDQQSIPGGAMIATRDAIDGLLEDLPRSTQVMLATLRRRVEVRHPFSHDLASVSAALARVQPAAGVDELKFVEFTDKVDQLCDGSQEQSVQQAIMLGKALIHETRQQLRSAADGLSALSRMLASIPGRKHIVLYSAGYPLDPTGAVIETIAGICGAGAQASQELTAVEPFDGTVLLQNLMDEANRAQVSFYAIDARGLMTDTLQAQQRGSPRLARRGMLPQVTRLDTVVPQQYLRAVAGDSGGRWFLNSNDLAKGLRSAWIDASEYYLVGYSPAGPRRKGRFHRIEVRVGRPDVDLRYRQGYREAAEKDLAERDLTTALQFPTLFETDDLDVETEIVAGRLKVVTFLQPAALVFTPAGDEHRCDIAVHAILRDAQGRLVGGKALFAKDVGLRLRSDRLAALRDSDNVEIPTDVAAPPAGRYVLTVVARHSGNRLAARTTELEAP
jgi:VWFA-related protein